jgi:hypothetical protein
MKQCDFDAGEFLEIQQRFAMMRAVRIPDDTYLVPGDFSELTFWLYSTRKGKGHEVVYIFPLSFSESSNQVTGLRLLLRPLLASHLRAELESLGLQIPATLTESAK